MCYQTSQRKACLKRILEILDFINPFAEITIKVPGAGVLEPILILLNMLFSYFLEIFMTHTKRHFGNIPPSIIV